MQKQEAYILFYKRKPVEGAYQHCTDLVRMAMSEANTIFSELHQTSDSASFDEALAKCCYLSQAWIRKVN